MMRALFSGVSGLKAHQTKMDVIGNNIANVNTYGYKSQRVTFKDTFYQTLSSSSDSNDTVGGGNPSQIGYGAVVNNIDVLHSRGGYVPTGQAMDLFIEGEGYLVARDANGNESYTRVGALNFDGSGNLVDGNKRYICGYPIARYTENVPAKASTLKLNDDVTVNFGDPNGSYFNGYKIKTVTDPAATATTASFNSKDKIITVTSNAALTPADLQTALRGMTAVPGSENLPQNIVDGLNNITVTGTGNITENKFFTSPAAGGDIAHNVGDLMFETIPAKSSEISVNNIKISFGDINGSFFNGYKVKTVYDASATEAASATVDVDSKVITITSNTETVSTTNMESALQKMTAEEGKGVLPATIDVSQITVDGSVSGSLATGVTSTKAINGVDVATRTVFDKTHGLQKIQKPGSLIDTNGDGIYDSENNNVMELKGIKIGENGIITGEFENNIIQLGQIVLADIPNPQALTLDGNSYLNALSNTGDINYYEPGEGSVGSLVAGGLENSNVDLANEFADMIMTQRGFQANSRIITVGDEMLQELVNLKR